MFYVIFILISILIVALSAVTTMPFSIPVLAVSAVIFRKSWVFFVAFLLGLFLDVISIRPLGYTGLIFAVFVFFVFLYKRKFETQTLTFVFFTTFLGSFIYLMIFGYNNVFFQSLTSALFAVLLFKLWLR